MTLFGKLLLLAILCFVWRTIRHVRNTELPDIEPELDEAISDWLNSMAEEHSDSYD